MLVLRTNSIVLSVFCNHDLEDKVFLLEHSICILWCSSYKSNPRQYFYSLISL